MDKIKSEKRPYNTEAVARAQQTLWEKKGYRVVRRRKVLYLKKGLQLR